MTKQKYSRVTTPPLEAVKSVHHPPGTNSDSDLTVDSPYCDSDLTVDSPYSFCFRFSKSKSFPELLQILRLSKETESDKPSENLLFELQACQ